MQWAKRAWFVVQLLLVLKNLGTFTIFKILLLAMLGLYMQSR